MGRWERLLILGVAVIGIILIGAVRTDLFASFKPVPTGLEYVDGQQDPTEDVASAYYLLDDLLAPPRFKQSAQSSPHYFRNQTTPRDPLVAAISAPGEIVISRYDNGMPARVEPSHQSEVSTSPTWYAGSCLIVEDVVLEPYRVRHEDGGFLRVLMPRNSPFNQPATPILEGLQEPDMTVDDVAELIRLNLPVAFKRARTSQCRDGGKYSCRMAVWALGKVVDQC